ncbi:hypothetical protein GCM10029992_33630 [Glycomyces albus]
MADVGHGQADDTGAPGLEDAGGDIDPVAGHADRLEDPLTHPSETGTRLFTTLDTVILETPAMRATSLMVGFPGSDMSRS